jgi:hypothetical protein
VTDGKNVIAQIFYYSSKVLKNENHQKTGSVKKIHMDWIFFFFHFSDIFPSSG